MHCSCRHCPTPPHTHTHTILPFSASSHPSPLHPPPPPPPPRYLSPILSAIPHRLPWDTSPSKCLWTEAFGEGETSRRRWLWGHGGFLSGECLSGHGVYIGVRGSVLIYIGEYNGGTGCVYRVRGSRDTGVCIGCVALGTRVCVLGVWLSGHGCVYRVRGSRDTGVCIGCVALGARGVFIGCVALGTRCLSGAWLWGHGGCIGCLGATCASRDYRHCTNIYTPVHT